MSNVHRAAVASPIGGRAVPFAAPRPSAALPTLVAPLEVVAALWINNLITCCVDTASV